MHVVREMMILHVDHIFMVIGHSYLPCDEDFGIDEKTDFSIQAE